MSDTLKAIGERIRAVRQKMNLYQGDFARLVGVDRVQISRWENGTREITVSDLEKLARATGREPNWYLGFEREPRMRFAAEDDMTPEEMLEAEDMLDAWKAARRKRRVPNA